MNYFFFYQARKHRNSRSYCEYLFKGEDVNTSNVVKVNLLLLHFIDENNIHFIYVPHLDLTGYGKDFNKAKTSLGIVLGDFIDYTLKKKTLGKVLKGLGWRFKGKVKNPKKVLAPSIKTVISKNNYVSDIFDKYPVNTYHEEVGIPAYA